jgi:hypothetical protein
MLASLEYSARLTSNKQADDGTLTTRANMTAAENGLACDRLSFLFDGARRIARRRPEHFAAFVLAQSTPLANTVVDAYRAASPLSSRAVVELLARFVLFVATQLVCHGASHVVYVVLLVCYTCCILLLARC